MPRFEYPINVETFTVLWHDCNWSAEGPHLPCQSADALSLEQAITHVPPKETGYVNLHDDDVHWVISPSKKGCREVVQYNPDGSEIVSDCCTL